MTLGEGRQPAATYYPAIAALEIRVGDDPPRWARLDDDRVRLLNRYIELGRAGALPKEPTILDVLAAEARAGRMTPASVDGRGVSPAALEEFWRVAGSAAWSEVHIYGSRHGAKLHTGAPADYDEGVEAMVYGYAEPVWLSFDVDGREVKLAYYPETAVVAGIPLPSNSAWIGRGFVIPPDLREAFHASLGLPQLAPGQPPTPAEAAVDLRGETGTDAPADGRLERLSGGMAALLIVALAALAVAVASAALVRGTRRREA